ncbi:MAG: inositol monophosphatase family protein [Planctomycetota bacterium]
MLEASRRLREGVLAAGDAVDLKRDGSPATRLEHEVEEGIRDRLRSFDASVAFVGEELGGSLPAEGEAVAVDPVDGTWAFLAESASWASTLAVLCDGQSIAGFVSNPTTGEIAYAVAGEKARLLRVSVFGTADDAVCLPRPARPSELPAVCFHPSRKHAATLDSLYRAWHQSRISVVRAGGGSPAWALVEAARSGMVYVNCWGGRAAEPFDLVAGVLIMRCAGGDVVDLSDTPIDPVNHAGPWVAGVDARQLAQVTELLRSEVPGL